MTAIPATVFGYNRLARNTRPRATATETRSGNRSAIRIDVIRWHSNGGLMHTGTSNDNRTSSRTEVPVRPETIPSFNRLYSISLTACGDCIARRHSTSIGRTGSIPETAIGDRRRALSTIVFATQRRRTQQQIFSFLSNLRHPLHVSSRLMSGRDEATVGRRLH